MVTKPYDMYSNSFLCYISGHLSFVLKRKMEKK